MPPDPTAAQQQATIDMPAIAFWVGDEDDLHRQLGRLVMAFATVDDWLTQTLAALLIHIDHQHDMASAHAAVMANPKLRLLDAHADEVEDRMTTQQRGTQRQVPEEVLHEFRIWRSAARLAQNRRNRIIHDAWAFTSGPEVMVQIRPAASELPANLDLHAEADDYADLVARGRNLMWAFRHVVFPATPGNPSSA